MHEFRADLHCHSTYSDGTLNPEQLIELAVARGLQGLSITDHDTVSSYPAALTLAEARGIKMFPGVEFSATQDGVSIHTLGYAFTHDHPAIVELCQEHTQRRTERNRAMLDRLAALGCPLEVSDLLAEGPQGSIGRPHIAMALVRKGYVENLAEAFKRYLKDGAQAYVPGPRITVERTLEVIHAAGGLAVIAHPHLIGQQNVIPKLLKLPFDGIEAYYAQFSLKQSERWLKIAEENQWLVTGGSDFHGAIKSTFPLGSSWAPQASFDILLTHYQRNIGS
jgi:predicted metal-dependent phosphoesterase TrpH